MRVIMQEIIKAARQFALQEIETYGLPSKEHFLLSEKKGGALARQLGAHEEIVHLGVVLMDIRLGEAVQDGHLEEHTRRGSETARQFLQQYPLLPEQIQNVVDCIEYHHGATKFPSLEAEICANADCYRFLHPRGFFFYLAVLGKRDLSVQEIFAQAEYKLDEKYQVLSLDICKQELEPYYETFKACLENARTI